MKKLIITVITAAMLINGVFAQKKINGVMLSPKIAPAKTVLVLNGGGVRTKHFIKVYVAGLYLQTKTKIAKDIIEADRPMSVRIHIISNLITNTCMAEVIREGFAKSTGGKTEPFKKELDLICTVFLSETIKIGDVFEIYYIPGKGVLANKNGQDQGVVITGLSFKKTVFGIWLSEDPVDENLKKGMLVL